MGQEVENASRIFAQRAIHHQANPQQVGELEEEDLEESETEGLVGTPEIIRPSLETFVQLPPPSAQPSIIPCLSPSQGQAPPQPSISQPPCQGASETGNVSRPSAHGAPMYLWNRCSTGWVPA